MVVLHWRGIYDFPLVFFTVRLSGRVAEQNCTQEDQEGRRDVSVV